MRISDWSSDVCSSDLLCRAAVGNRTDRRRRHASGGTAPQTAGRRCGGSAVERTCLHCLQQNCTCFVCGQYYCRQDCPFHASDDIASWRTDQGCRSEEHTSELQSLMRISYAAFCLKK